MSLIRSDMLMLTHTYREDDADWPQKSVVGKQELEIKSGNHHVSFELGKLGSLVDVQNSDSPESLRVLYYLIQDLRVSSMRSSGYCRCVCTFD